MDLSWDVRLRGSMGREFHNGLPSVELRIRQHRGRDDTSLQSWGGGPWGSRSYPYYQLYAPNNAGGSLVDYLYNGEFVRIDNVAFWIYFAYDSPILNPGSGFNVSGSINANGPYCVQNSCTFSWTCTYASSAVSPYGVYPSSTGAIPFAGTAYLGDHRKFVPPRLRVQRLSLDLRYF